MSEKAAAGRVLALVDGSAGSKAAATLAIEIARRLHRSLEILGASRGGAQDAIIAAAVSQALAQAKQSLDSVDGIQSTGEILSEARRRASETPTALVVLGANPRPRQRTIAPGIWHMIRSLAPPVLVTPPGSWTIHRLLFCTGGERFIDEGAQFTASLAAAFGSRVVVFHVSPRPPTLYGEGLARQEESPEDFLRSNSRLARNIRRQVEIFAGMGVETTFHLAEGDVAPAVLAEMRRGSTELLVVGSSPTRGALRTYVLGDFAREIAGRAARPFLVVRSRLPGFWTELWRALTEHEPAAPKEPEGARS